jgi:mannosylglycerate hydrolase MGH1-like protein
VSLADAAADAVAERAIRECERVLRQNWNTGDRGGTRFAYTCPSPHRYPWQWYWDSCLTAVAWRHFDQSRCRAELESLLAAADEDGFIGHTIFWGKPVTFPRLLFYNVRSRQDLMTGTIQPPLLAWAWKIAVGDPRLEPRIVRHHEAIVASRDLEGDGLLWIIQPDETGLDASPAFDSVWRWRSDGLPGFPLLVARNRRLGFDARRVRAAGGPLLCATLVNVIHGLSQLALGRPSITPALIERLYDEKSGRFVHDVWPVRTGPKIETWSTLSPLALPDLPEEIGRRLVEEHLLDARRFWLPVPPPSVAANERAFSMRDRFFGLRRYWRGPTWVNSGWLVWLGLVRLGYEAEASTLARALLGAVAEHGLREYYNPNTASGMGARDFAWSALVSEFVAADPRAARSYL